MMIPRQRKTKYPGNGRGYCARILDNLSGSIFWKMLNCLGYLNEGTPEAKPGFCETNGIDNIFKGNIRHLSLLRFTSFIEISHIVLPLVCD